MTMRNAFADMATEVSASDASALLRRILLMLLAPLGYDKSLRRFRQTAVIESGTVTTVTTVTTVATVTTVGAVTTLNQIAGRDAGTMLINPTNRTSWALNVRSRIT